MDLKSDARVEQQTLKVLSSHCPAQFTEADGRLINTGSHQSFPLWHPVLYCGFSRLFYVHVKKRKILFYCEAAVKPPVLFLPSWKNTMVCHLCDVVSVSCETFASERCPIQSLRGHVDVNCVCPCALFIYGQRTKLSLPPPVGCRTYFRSHSWTQIREKKGNQKTETLMLMV